MPFKIDWLFEGEFVPLDAVAYPLRSLVDRRLEQLGAGTYRIRRGHCQELHRKMGGEVTEVVVKRADGSTSIEHRGEEGT